MLQQSTKRRLSKCTKMIIKFFKKMWSVGPELFTFILPFKRARPPIIQKPSTVEALFIFVPLAGTGKWPVNGGMAPR